MDAKHIHELNADEAIDAIERLRKVDEERLDELEQLENDRVGGPRKSVLAAITKRREEGEPAEPETPAAEEPAEPVPPTPEAELATAETLSLEERARRNVRASGNYSPGSYGDQGEIQAEMERLKAEDQRAEG